MSSLFENPSRTAAGASRRLPRWALLLVLALAACSRVEVRPGEEGVDLARLLPVAEVEQVTEKIPVGTPAARRFLLSGFSFDEKGERPYVWSLGEAAELQFFKVEPTPLLLLLDCVAGDFGWSSPQRVEVLLNGEKVGEVEVGEVLAERVLEVDAARVREGRNLLAFRHAHHLGASGRAPPGENRPLAVQWYGIEIRRPGIPPGRAAGQHLRLLGEEEASSLAIPVDHRLSYYFDAAAGSELWIPAVERGRAAAGARLRVSLEASGGGEPEVAEVEGGSLRLSLPGEEGELLRISLAVSAPPPEAGLGARLGRGLGSLFAAAEAEGMVLHAPRLLRARPAAAGRGSEVSADRAPTEPEGSEVPERPNVIVYLIDTLRADHLGVYGYERPTSPNIDRFARRAILFENAQAQSSWTRTAVTSIITGLNPQAHRVNGREDALPDSALTLAELLDQAGYTTIAYITNGNVDARFAMDQGYDYYVRLRESRQKPEIHVLSDAVNEVVFRFLEGEEVPEPYFLFIHVSDPHAPYWPPEPFRSRFAADVPPEVGLIDNVRPIAKGEKPAPPGTLEHFVDLYDAEIASNDHHFGRLIEKLEEVGHYDDALIVLLSDHGEEFFEHGGWEHGRTLAGDQLNVPLILKLPGGEGAGLEVDSVVRQVDLLPTLLDRLGLEIPEGLDGRSLLPQVRASPSPGPPVSYSLLSIDNRILEGAVARGWKLVEDRSADGLPPIESLYHMAEDPLEQREVKDLHPVEWGYLRQALRALRLAERGRRRDAPEEAELDDELRETLKNLGYLN